MVGYTPKTAIFGCSTRRSVPPSVRHFFTFVSFLSFFFAPVYGDEAASEPVLPFAWPEKTPILFAFFAQRAIVAQDANFLCKVFFPLRKLENHKFHKGLTFCDEIDVSLFLLLRGTAPPEPPAG